MPVRVFIIITSIFWSFSTYPQNAKSKKVDSLISQLNTYQGNNTKKVDLLNATGYEYWIVDTDKSIQYGNESLLLAKELNYNKGIAVANRVIGVAYWAQGNQNAAFKYLTQSQKMFTTIENEEGIANVTLNIGMIYADLKEYDKALRHFNDAIDKFTVLSLTSRIATTYTKIGTVYIEKKDFNGAQTHLTNALRLHNQNNFKYGIAEAHNRLGILYIEKNELEQAYYHIERSIKIGQEIGDKDGLTNNLIQYGKLLRLDTKYELAEDHLKLGVQKSRENNLKKYELLAYQELRELKRQQGKTNEALDYYDQYILLKDSIFNSNESKQIAYIEFENQLTEKNQELFLLQEKEKINNLIKWGLILGILVLFLGSFMIIKSIRDRSQKNKELLKKHQELSASQEELSKTALENAHLKQQELKQQLDFKNKELTSYALNFVRKNELLDQLLGKVNLAKSASPKQKEKIIAELSKTIKQHASIDKDWEDFKRFFEEVHVNFYPNLKKKHPDLSTNDLKICSLTRLNFNIKETASILGISPESAKTARYRLRKKLELDQEQELFSYFIEVENQ